jgi:hypothetical protein
MTDAVPPVTDTRRQALLAFSAERAKASLTRFLYVDHGGIVRGKAAATARLAERIESGIGHTRAMMVNSPVKDMNSGRHSSQNSPSDVTKAHHSRPLTKATVTLLPVSTWRTTIRSTSSMR